MCILKDRTRRHEISIGQRHQRHNDPFPQRMLGSWMEQA